MCDYVNRYHCNDRGKKAQKAYNHYNGFRYTFYKDETINKIAHKLTLLVATIVKDYRYSKIKSFNREEIGLYEALEYRTFRKLDYIDYYTRAIEIALEYLKVDHFKIYHYEVAKSIIIDRILAFKIENNDFMLNYNKQKTSQKKREYLTKVLEKDILAYASNEIHDGRFLPKDFVLNILAVYPQVVIILTLMMVWSDFDAEEEKNFGFTFEFEE